MAQATPDAHEPDKPHPNPRSERPITTSDWHRGSKRRLTPHDARHFDGDTLFDAFGRTVCEASCLPRKELYESWEVAKRMLRRMKGGPVIDVAGGHGLVAWILTLVDRSTPQATCIDTRIPDSAHKLHAVLSRRWPQVGEKVHYHQAPMADAPVTPDTRVVAVHACGGLTDQALDLALSARARVAALPCCHSHRKLDAGGLAGWLPRPMAIDVTRAARLRNAGYDVWTLTIPEDITPENRLMLAAPREPSSRVG